MDHQNLEKLTSATRMLPKQNSTEKVVIIAQNNGGVGKILIREDTILANIQGCAGCGRTQLNCSGEQNQWSGLCWGKQSEKKYICLVILLAITFILSLVGTLFFSFTNTINDAILSNMVIRNNSMAYDLWRYPTVQPYMRVHIFNYTNWDRVRYGLDKKLKVQEVGPYVYAQQIERVNVNFEDDLLSYQERNTFRFLPEHSTGSQMDEVIVPNLPLIGVTARALRLKLLPLALFSLNSALTWTGHHDAFLKLPVHGFLWGYDDDIIAAAKPILSITGNLKFDRFGLLVTKNGTTAEHITINTGQKDINKMNLIQKVDGREKLSYWSDPECNSIESSDGTIFPPSMLDKKKTLYVFYSNLCRRVPFLYDHDVHTSDGVPLLRYKMPTNVFDDPKHNPYNQCFCDMESNMCPPRGIVNVTACVMDSPVLASFPHFHLGDEKLTQDIIGLMPQESSHDSYIDIHPTLGIALGGKSSIQINVQVKKHPAFSSLRYLEDDLILPIAFLEVSVGELPESLRSLIYHGTYSSEAARLALIWGCVIGLFVSGLSLLVIFLRRKRKPCATLKKIPVDTELKSQNIDGDFK